MDELRTFETIQDYYEAEPEARFSIESDYGVWWKDDDGGNWRVSYVHDTGDVYAISSGRTISKNLRIGDEVATVVSAGSLYGPVVVLGRLEPWTNDDDFVEPEPVREALDGWVEECGKQGSLAWVLERVREHGDE